MKLGLKLHAIAPTRGRSFFIPLAIEKTIEFNLLLSLFFIEMITGISSRDLELNFALTTGQTVKLLLIFNKSHRLKYNLLLKLKRLTEM